MEREVFRALVLGGGIVGLAALESLAARGARPVALLERRRLGHALGGSHGAARLHRAGYPDALWVRLANEARDEDWPRLESRAGAQLLHPADLCLFGPPEGPLEAYATAVESAGARVERIELSEARRRFPELRFDGAAGALRDRTAAVIDAEGTREGFARLARGAGAEIFEERRACSIDLEADPLRVATDRGTLRAERLVIATGGWTEDLLPELAEHLRPLRQVVGYFDHPGAKEPLGFAPFAWLGPGAAGIHYGLPALGEPGIKAACHRTDGPAEDPEDDATPGGDEAAIERLRGVLTRLLARPLGATLRCERCLYTMAPTEDFVLALHPRDPRVAVCSGLSGHGFKFAPLLGRAIAGLLLDGRTGSSAIDGAAARFALPIGAPPGAGSPCASRGGA